MSGRNRSFQRTSNDFQNKARIIVADADTQREHRQRQQDSRGNPNSHQPSSAAGCSWGSSIGSPKVIFSIGGSSSKEDKPKVLRKSGVVRY